MLEWIAELAPSSADCAFVPLAETPGEPVLEAHLVNTGSEDAPILVAEADDQIELDQLDNLSNLASEQELGSDGYNLAEEPLILPSDLDPQSSSGETLDSPPIIVTGQRINAGTGGDFFDRTAGGSEIPGPEGDTTTLEPTGAEGWTIPDEPTDFDPPKVAAEVVEPATAEERAKVQEAAEKMTAEVARLTPKINALPDDKQVRMADGAIITGAELKALWNTIDFVITNRTFGQGRAGAFDPNKNIATFSATDALGYDRHPNGLSFALLHEVVHHSPEGRNVDMDQWNNYLRRVGVENASYAEYVNAPEFAENEEYANAGALRAAMELGVSPVFDGSHFVPNHGYEYGDPN